MKPTFLPCYSFDIFCPKK